MGIGMALGGIAGGLASSSAAKKASKDNRAAADAATQLQREQFEQTTQNFAPFLAGGRDAMAAYLFEMGLGPRPTIGGRAADIITVPGAEREQTYRTGSPGSEGDRRTRTRMVRDPDQFKVGDRTFTTLSEAEAFAKQNPVGGTEYGGYSTSPMARYLMEEGVDSIEGSAAAGGGLFSGATLEALEGNRRRVIQADTSDYFNRLTGLTSMGMGAAGNQANAGAAFASNVGNLQMSAANASGQARMAGAQAFNNTLGDVAGIAGYFGWGGQNNPMAAYAAPTMNFGGGR